MQITFVSNYINHHQIPFSNAMFALTGGSYTFVQTEPMEQERMQMGWQAERPVYVKYYYEEPESCRQLILDSDMVIFGGTDEEAFIEERLAAGKPVLRYSERLYKTGQWKAVSPRGLRKKYHDHTRYRKAPVYLLCSGAYVPSDFHIVRAYPGKMYCWGYFTETKHYDVDKLMAEKGYADRAAAGTDRDATVIVAEKDRETTAVQPEKIPYLLWAGRFIDWKHPELALETARYLKQKGLRFHMDIIGGGELEPWLRQLREQYDLEDVVDMVGFKKPEEVRRYMEQADIHLFTSDRQEGWGAVANEAMNSGCALVANHMIGAVPYLIQQGQNGFAYRDGDKQMLFARAEQLVRDSALRERLGRNAYATITEVWNAENAAQRVYHLIGELLGKASGEAQMPQGGANGRAEDVNEQVGLAPCMPAPVISERKMWKKLLRYGRNS